MPYIPQSKRKYCDTLFNPDSDITHPGTLNYVITKEILAFIDRTGGISQEKVAEVLGVLVCCLLEFWRRKGREASPATQLLDIKGLRRDVSSYKDANRLAGEVVLHMLQQFDSELEICKLYNWYKLKLAPYEDKKREQHGDVYE